MHGISNEVQLAIVAGTVAILTTLMGLIFKRLDGIHKMVNSTATIAQTKLDAGEEKITDLRETVSMSVEEVAKLNKLIVQLQVSLAGASPSGANIPGMTNGPARSDDSAKDHKSKK